MENILRHILFVWILCKGINSQISSFSNPVLDNATRNAVVIKNHDNYYLAYADNTSGELMILKSPYLTDFRNAEIGVVYRRPPGFIELYPSSFFKFQNDLYLYFHMGTETTPEQIFAIKAQDSANPMGMWSAPIRVFDYNWNQLAVFGVPFQVKGQLYLVWSSFTDSNPYLSLYIAKMKNPTEVLEPVVLLREANEDWVCNLNGPSFLYNQEKVYMAITTCVPNTTTGTSLSYLSIEIGMDLLIPSNWKAGQNSVYQGNQEQNVYQPRYSDFTTSPDGTETWMLLTTSTNLSDINGSSRVRIEKVDFNRTSGTPIFPEAMANGYQQQLPSGEPYKYYNPVSGDLSPAFPNAYRVGDTFYTVQITDEAKKLMVLKSDKLYDYSNADTSVVYTAPAGLGVGDGRIFEISGEAYLYFHTFSSSQGIWVYVMKAENSSNLMQNWGPPIRLLDNVLDGRGFHPHVLWLNNQLYLTWGHSNNDSSNDIYIARMLNPTAITQPAILLKKPTQSWECYDRCTNEYTSFLYHQNLVFMTFSASFAGHPDSSLSYMSIETGRDPLDITNWYTAPGPVFTRNDEENVYSVGHAYFTTSPDGLEDWMMYRASEGWNIRIQKIGWDETTGHPVFPKAHGTRYPLAIPSEFQYFTNPITDDTSVSPGVVRVGNFYYMLVSSEGGSEIHLFKSGKLEDFRMAEGKVIYSVPAGHAISGSSKMHKINEQLFIYFSMNTENSSSQIFVLQAQDPSNPMGVWNTKPTLLALSWSYPAFQSTVLEHGGHMYLVWISPHPATGFNSIFIAEMKNATHILEPLNLIRHPTELWECDGGCSNEAPYFIYNSATAYMVHSVGSACKGGNALTYMSIGKNEDPMNVVNWNKAPGKVFSESQDESVFCPSHASFTFSPDGKENWMVYHATDSPHPDAVKTARIEKISWHLETGEPIFPEPHGLYHQQLVPSRKAF